MFLTRRHFLLLSAATATSAIVGCGKSAAAEPQLVSLFSSNRVIAAGIPQRLPFGVVNNGLELPDSTALSVRVLSEAVVIDELEVLGRVVRHDHTPGADDHQHADLQRYYAVRTTLPEPGIYDLEIRIGDHTVMLPVQAFDRSEIGIPLPGDAFPPIDTPTLDDARGVDPICTLAGGPCAFHHQTAAQIMAEGRPLVFLVATPAFCATAYCGPVLETLIEGILELGSGTDLGVVHVEPWANPRVGQGLNDPGLRLAPSLDLLGLEFEPVMFLVDPTGVIVDRIDNVFDRSELEDALGRLLG
ncbi:MAG: hypothetical protein O3C27_00830 [Actinomycetota bacterium]|nr:hypothetical protein [Actinomycetota bacterium]